ncbi:hypothetical protein [Frankia sp. Cas3]|uniref:hypothetical protein n=1 Tax=Frankia sp. Cas3 TaxID=3073926 RepID=UPI002AD497ED|nr:hypothetical protein [Frankia sp. Cas3]
MDLTQARRPDGFTVGNQTAVGVDRLNPPSFEPFTHVPREQATVGALRKRAEGHDIAVRSRSHRLVEPDQKREANRPRMRAAMSAAQ